MISRVYRALVGLHPREFRSRFESDMLCTFEDAVAERGAASLLIDILVSLGRQWVLHGRLLTICGALAGAAFIAFVGINLQVPVPRRLRHIPVQSAEAFFFISACASLLAIMSTTLVCITWFRLSRQLRKGL